MFQRINKKFIIITQNQLKIVIIIYKLITFSIKIKENFLIKIFYFYLLFLVPVSVIKLNILVFSALTLIGDRVQLVVNQEFKINRLEVQRPSLIGRAHI